MGPTSMYPRGVEMIFLAPGPQHGHVLHDDLRLTPSACARSVPVTGLTCF